MLEHPPQLWHNSQLSTSAQILSMIIDNWQLLPTINLLASKIRSLNSVFSSSLGLKQPSLSASYLQERVNEGRGQRLGGVANYFARARFARDRHSTSLLQILDTPLKTLGALHGISYMLQQLHAEKGAAIKSWGQDETVLHILV